MPGNLIGENFQKYVNDEINIRQKTHGVLSERSADQISYLNSRNAWIKMASSVILSSTKYKSVTNKTTGGTNDGGKLAKEYILFNGTSDLRKGNKYGVLGESRNPAYGIGGLDFGPVPMPGIIDLTHECINKGSVKKTKLNLICHNREQFDIIDVLYLRLGFTVLVEWGNDKYLNKSGGLEYVGETLIDDKFWRYNNHTYEDVLPEIEKNRKKYQGNYDGVYGTITNFSWTFEDDGSYKIKMEIMSLGDVIESLKANLPPIGKIGNTYHAAKTTLHINEFSGQAATEAKFYGEMYPHFKDALKKWYNKIRVEGAQKYIIQNTSQVWYYVKYYQENIDWTVHDRQHDTWYNDECIRSMKTKGFKGVGDAIDFDKIGQDTGTGTLPPPHNVGEKVEGVNYGNIPGGLNEFSTEAIYQEEIFAVAMDTIYNMRLATNFGNRGQKDKGGIGNGKRFKPIDAVLSGYQDNPDNKIITKWFTWLGNFNNQTFTDNEKGYDGDDAEHYDDQKEKNVHTYWTSETREDKLKNTGMLQYLQFHLKTYRWDMEETGVQKVKESDSKWIPGNLYHIGSEEVGNEGVTYTEKFKALKLSSSTSNPNLIGMKYVGDSNQFFGDYDYQKKIGKQYKPDSGHVHFYTNFNDDASYLRCYLYLNTIMPTSYKNFHLLLGKDVDEFYTNFYNACVRVNRAGGEMDPRFSSYKEPEMAEDPDGFITDAEKYKQSSAETKDANRIQKWFYEVRNVKLAGWTSTLRSSDMVWKNGVKRISPRLASENFNVWNDGVIFPKYEISDWNSTYLKTTHKDVEKYTQGGDEKGKSEGFDFFEIAYNGNTAKKLYVRLGCFLEFLETHVIPKMTKGSKKVPMLSIHTNSNDNICFAIDNSISADPRVCLVRNDSFYNGQGQDDLYEYFPKFINYYKEDSGRKDDFGEPIMNNYYYGRVMAIMMNCDYLEKLLGDTDNHNNIMIFDVLKTICNDINRSLGGINTLEPVIDQDNAIRLIDQTPIPGIRKICKYLDIPRFKVEETVLEIYGYNGEEGKDSRSNFIHKAGITTEINKNFSSMIAIGATANGSIPGFEATAFSKWNFGIFDRFKNNIVDAVAEADESLEDQNENVKSAYTNFASGGSEKLGVDGTNQLYDPYIELNLSSITNFYRYAIAWYAKNDNKGTTSTGVGFLPFNLKLTMDGLSGIKIYNKVEVNTSFLPVNYGDTLSFLITGVNHKISKNQWITELKTLATSQGQFNAKITQTINTKKLLGAFGSGYTAIDTAETSTSADVLEVGTLGTQDTDIKNKNAYKDGDELKAAIKPGLDILYAWKQKTHVGMTANLVKTYYLLRSRIILIAASYVGQESDGRVQTSNSRQSVETIGKGGYPAWKMLDSRWNKTLTARGGAWPQGYSAPKSENGVQTSKGNPNGGSHWCNQFCNTVWGEAYTTGNRYVKDKFEVNTNNYIDISNKRMYPFQPLKIRGGTYAESKEIYAYDVKYGLNTPNPGYTMQSFKNVNQWIEISGNSNTMWQKIADAEILPGDLIIYNKPHYNWGDGYPNGGHIGIYIGINVKDASIVTIEGNIGHNDNANYTTDSSRVKRITVSNNTVKKKVKGFCKVFLNDDPRWVVPPAPVV